VHWLPGRWCCGDCRLSGLLKQVRDVERCHVATSLLLCLGRSNQCGGSCGLASHHSCCRRVWHLCVDRDCVRPAAQTLLVLICVLLHHSRVLITFRCAAPGHRELGKQHRGGYRIYSQACRQSLSSTRQACAAGVCSGRGCSCSCVPSCRGGAFYARVAASVTRFLPSGAAPFVVPVRVFFSVWALLCKGRGLAPHALPPHEL